MGLKWGKVKGKKRSKEIGQLEIREKKRKGVRKRERGGKGAGNQGALGRKKTVTEVRKVNVQKRREDRKPP